MCKSLSILLLLTIFICNFTAAIPLRSLFLRSYDDFNQEAVAPRMFFSGGSQSDGVVQVDASDNGSDNRPKRGLDLLKRRVEIIERNRCFFNPITCY